MSNRDEKIYIHNFILIHKSILQLWGVFPPIYRIMDIIVHYISSGVHYISSRVHMHPDARG